VVEDLWSHNHCNHQILHVFLWHYGLIQALTASTTLFHWLNWFHPADVSLRICNMCFFCIGMGSSAPHPRDLEDQSTSLGLATHLKPVPHGLLYYQLGCCWHSFRIHWGTQAPSPSRKYALKKVEVPRGTNAPYISTISA
jgi:hypothetical protein